MKKIIYISFIIIILISSFNTVFSTDIENNVQNFIEEENTVENEVDIKIEESDAENESTNSVSKIEQSDSDTEKEESKKDELETLENSDTNKEENIENFENLSLEELQKMLSQNLSELENAYDKLYELSLDKQKEDYEKLLKEIDDLVNEKEEIILAIANYTGLEEEEIIENVKPEDDKTENTSNAWNEQESMMENQVMQNSNFTKNENVQNNFQNMGMGSSVKVSYITYSADTEKVTYQGSQNNYLSSLSIENVPFTKEFKKTTTNYFCTVDTSITSVNVSAVAEDSDSIVTIYGNTDLQEGKNKIIVSVTSESGNVRIYRIYITK